MKKEENKFVYRFSDQPINKDIETFGKIFLNDLEKFIDDGIQKSF